MERMLSASSDLGLMIVAIRSVDAIVMIAQIAGAGAGSKDMMIEMITSEPGFLAVEAMEAIAVDTAAVVTTDQTRVRARTFQTLMTCSMAHVMRTHTWRTESRNRITR